MFLDGVGLGDDAEYNPFTSAALPHIHALLDGRIPLVTNAPFHAQSATLVALDATLGVEGTPQSGTGQTALFTGANAAELHGAHFGPWVPTKLRAMLREESVLAKAVAAGLSVTFANAYPEELIRMADDPAIRLPKFLRAGPPIAAMGASVFTRNATDLMAGNAVASEILNDGWRKHLGIVGLPEVSAREAGVTLAGIAAGYDLTLFAHYRTDTVGHEKDLDRCVEAMERVDAFIGGIVERMPPEMTLVIASDHGNIEDTRTGHTRNPVMGIVAGPNHREAAAGATSLLDVAPMIMRLLDVS